MEASEPARPAPGDLRLVQDFVNTLDLELGTDEIADTASLAAWLTARGLKVDQATSDEVERAHAVRQALRRLALANNGGSVYPLDIAILNQVASENPLRVRFLPTGAARLEPQTGGASAALAKLLQAVQGAIADGSWKRLKACREDTCQWLFYDSSKNHSGAWCTMSVCGNRSKARRYRAKRSGGSS
jgi:predicted RNA-binding Zn ribbon-like protein